jgi:hypothetical protein
VKFNEAMLQALQVQYGRGVPPGRRKYGNQKVELDGYVFDSKREARRYQDLKALQLLGEISSLCANKKALRYPLVVNGHVIATYVADFRYLVPAHDGTLGTYVVEDAKGVRTATYRMKKKLMRACWNIEIQEV